MLCIFNFALSKLLFPSITIHVRVSLKKIQMSNMSDSVVLARYSIFLPVLYILSCKEWHPYEQCASSGNVFHPLINPILLNQIWPYSWHVNMNYPFHIRSRPFEQFRVVCNGPLTRYKNVRVAHAPWMPGTFSPPPPASDPDMHHGTCVTHLPWCMPGSLSNQFRWSRWRKKTFPAFPAHAQFYVSGKRPIMSTLH